LVDATGPQISGRAAESAEQVAFLRDLTRRAHDPGHWVAVGMHRANLAEPDIRELIESAPVRLMASDLFAHSHDSCLEEGRLAVPTNGEVPRELAPLLAANSDGLRRCARAFLDGQRGAGPVDLLKLADSLLREGFLEAAYRLELHSRPREGATSDVQISGDLMRLKADANTIVGLIDPVIEAPRAIERTVLSGDSGAGKTIALSQIEHAFALPTQTLRGRPAPSWLPVLLRLEAARGDDPGKWLRDEFLAHSQINSGAGTGRRTLGAHVWLARHATATSLEWNFSSPVLYLLDGWSKLGQQAQDEAGAWLEQLYVDSPRAGLVFTSLGNMEEPSGKHWFNLWLKPNFRIQVRALDKDRVSRLLEALTAEQANAILAMLGYNERSISEAVRNPFLLACLIGMVRRGSEITSEVTLHLLLQHFVEECLPFGAHTDALRLADEVLPTLAFDRKRHRDECAMPPELLTLACNVRLLELGAPPRFAHRLLEDYFASRRLSAEMTDKDIAAVLPERLANSPRLLEAEWEHVFRFLIGSQHDEQQREKVLAYLVAQKAGTVDTRPGELLALRCAREFGDVPPPGTALGDARLRTAARIKNRWPQIVAGNREAWEQSREDALALGRLDPRLAPEYAIGSADELTRALETSGFCVSRFPVTNLEFARFVQAGGYDAKCKKYWHPSGWALVQKENIRWPEFWTMPELTHPSAPVIGVSFHEALAFARWTTETSHLVDVVFGLPTEFEWSKAAGLPSVFSELTQICESGPEAGKSQISTEELVDSIGKLIRDHQCEFRTSGPFPIGLFPPAASGAHDLFGNVWEWCDDWFIGVDSPSRPSTDEQSATGPVFVRGGPAPDPVNVRAVTSLIGSGLDPFSRVANVGFRLCIRHATPAAAQPNKGV
jgi:formylglycine-generating enzyme required for sulfatase activity